MALVICTLCVAQNDGNCPCFGFDLDKDNGLLVYV